MPIGRTGEFIGRIGWLTGWTWADLRSDAVGGQTVAAESQLKLDLSAKLWLAASAKPLRRDGSGWPHRLGQHRPGQRSLTILLLLTVMLLTMLTVLRMAVAQ